MGRKSPEMQPIVVDLPAPLGAEETEDGARLCLEADTGHRDEIAVFFT